MYLKEFCLLKALVPVIISIVVVAAVAVAVIFNTIEAKALKQQKQCVGIEMHKRAKHSSAIVNLLHIYCVQEML